MPWASVKTLAVCRDWVAQHGSPLNLLFLNIFALRIIMSYAIVFFSFLYLVATSKMPVGVTHFRTTKAECRKKHHCLHLRFYFPLPVFFLPPQQTGPLFLFLSAEWAPACPNFRTGKMSKKSEKKTKQNNTAAFGNTLFFAFLAILCECAKCANAPVTLK